MFQVQQTDKRLSNLVETTPAAKGNTKTKLKKMAKRQQFRLKPSPNIINVNNNRNNQQPIPNSKKLSQPNNSMTLEIPRMDFLKVPEQNVEIKARIVPHQMRHYNKSRKVLNSTLQGSIRRIEEESEFR